MTLDNVHIYVAANGRVTKHTEEECELPNARTSHPRVGTDGTLSLRNEAVTWTDAYGGVHTGPEDSVPEDRA